MRIKVVKIKEERESYYTRVSEQNFENFTWKKIRNKCDKYIIEIFKKEEYGNQKECFIRIKKIECKRIGQYNNINDSWMYYKLKKTAK